MQVRFMRFVASSIISLISLNSFATYMPWPLFVFSPGLMIHMFFAGAWVRQ
jgi:uncharacterized RDD family membrane protein YckC